MRRTAVVIILILIVSICRWYLYRWTILRIWYIENLLSWRTKLSTQVLYRCHYILADRYPIAVILLETSCRISWRISKGVFRKYYWIWTRTATTPELYVAIKLHSIVKCSLCTNILSHFCVFLEVNRTVTCIYSGLYGVKSPFYVRAETTHKHSRQIMLQCAIRRPPRWIWRRWSLASQKHKIVIKCARLLQLTNSFPCNFYYFFLL